MSKCPICGAPEIEAMTPRTIYDCGSSDYDQRPGTFIQMCKPMNKEYRVTPEMLEAVIIKEEYQKLGTKMTACVLTLENGHEVVGIAGVVDPGMYDIEIGSKYAREKAVEQLWPLLGYVMQVKMHEETKDIKTAKEREESHMGWSESETRRRNG